MTTETILTDEQIAEQFEWYVDDPEHTNTFMVFARAIEQAVLQSDEVQAMRSDSEELCGLKCAIEELNKNGSLPYSLEEYLP